jgi:hypothetical protein
MIYTFKRSRSGSRLSHPSESATGATLERTPVVEECYVPAPKGQAQENPKFSEMSSLKGLRRNDD